MPARSKPKARPAPSEDESDTSMPVLQAQHRIQQLRKQKEERLRSVVAESHAALENLRSEVQKHYDQERQKGVEAQAKHIATLVESMERRKDIEAEMMDLIVMMSTRMKDVEAMILAGYDGRLEEVRSMLG